MARGPLVPMLVLFCFGQSSQTALTQADPTLSVAPGQTATLRCTLQGVEFISSTTPAWYQRRPGSSPRLLIYHSRSRASGVPERFSADTSGNTALLTITGVQAEDEADYYCAVWHSDSWLFGSGTQLTVLGQPKASPTVHLFPPSSEELSTQSKATLVCLMDNFYPGSVQVTWKADGAPITSGVETTKPSKQSNNQYMASSYLKLSASEWKSHESYTCLVTHDGKSTDKTLKRSECS